MALVPRMDCAVEPLKTILPVPLLKVPLLVRFPARFMVPALLLKVPLLLRLPATVCVLLPEENVVPLPMVSDPPKVIPADAVLATVPLRIKSPEILVVPVGKFFVPEPDKVRLLYLTAFMVWLPALLYATVLAVVLAISDEIATVVELILITADAPFVNEPVPCNAVETVSVPVLVMEPFMVILGIMSPFEPPKVFALPVKV